MGGATWKGKASGFDPTKGLIWTAKTDVRVIRDLVRDREDVAARHRRYENSSRQDKSENKVSSLLKQPVMRACVDRYSEFCQALNMPTYPLTTATIALFLFAKCSHDNKDYTTNLRYLKRLQEASKTIWDECCEFNVEDTEVLRGGLKEFQAERVRVKSTTRAAKLRARGDSPDGEDIDNVEVEQLYTPGLPQPGDRFESKEEFLAATYVALLPIYGTGARHVSTTRYIECSRAHTSYRGSQEGECEWRIGMKKDQVTGEVIVAKEGSNFYHNHGPAPRLIKDPSWRPLIKNKLVRQRLGMGELIPKKRCSIAEPASSASESSESDSGAESNSQFQISFKKPKLLRHDPPPFAMPSPSYASTSVQNPSDEAARNDSPLLHPLPRQYPSQLQYPPSSVYTQPQSILHQYQSQFEYPSDPPSQDYARPGITALSPSSSDPFLPRLASFLRSLHSSLDSLALPLYSSGIKSKELLDLFCAFESTTFDSYFILLKERNPDQEISNVHVRLLKKKLKEAQDGDWAS